MGKFIYLHRCPRFAAALEFGTYSSPILGEMPLLRSYLIHHLINATCKALKSSLTSTPEQNYLQKAEKDSRKLDEQLLTLDTNWSRWTRPTNCTCELLNAWWRPVPITLTDKEFVLPKFLCSISVEFLCVQATSRWHSNPYALFDNSWSTLYCDIIDI